MNSAPTLEVLDSHVSIRSFTNEPIEDEVLDQIIKSSRRAPTSSNMQAYSIIVIKDPEVKQELALLAGGQKYVATCPVFLAFCADLHRLEVACEMHDLTMTNNLETFLISTIDASLVGMTAMTAAESLGLGVVMIGAMRNHPSKVARLLGLPSSVYVTFGMCLGWPEQENIPPQKPRLPEQIVVHQEMYALSNLAEQIKQHDLELSGHYVSLGKNLQAAAWSGPISRNLSGPMRSENLAILNKMGFNICLGSTE